MNPKLIPLPIGVRGRLANESLWAAIAMTSVLAAIAAMISVFSFSTGEMLIGTTMALITLAMGFQASIFNNKREAIVAFKALR